MPLLPPEDPNRPIRDHLEPGQWRRIVAGLLARHGLSDRGLAPFATGSDVVWGTHEVVLKLTTPPWRFQIDAEQRWLETVAGAVPAPQFIASGTLEDWPYVVTERLPGQALGDLWPRAGRRARLAWAERLGEMTGRLQRVSVEPDPHWDTFVADNRVGLEAREADLGLDGLGEYVDRLHRPEAPHVLLHTELIGDHILVEGEHIVGLIDFADGRVGHPLYEVAGPVQFLFLGEAGMLAAYFDGLGRPVPPAEELLAWALLHRYGRMARVTGHLAIRPESPQHLASLAFSCTPER